MLDAAPGGLLQVNRGTETNRLTDLLRFIPNGILKSGKQNIRDTETFKIQCPRVE